MSSVGEPTSNQTPSIALAYIGHPISKRRGKRFLEKSYFSPSGTRAITSGSRMYNPALITLENASSGRGFSLNFRMYPSRSSPSTSPSSEFERPTIPNGLGSSTSQRAIVAFAPLSLCAWRRAATSKEATESPEPMITVSVISSMRSRTEPAVPIGVCSWLIRPDVDSVFHCST